MPATPQTTAAPYYVHEARAREDARMNGAALAIDERFAPRVKRDEPMSRHTTLRLGGPADIWAEPHHVDALIALLQRCSEQSIPVCQVGSGTNLLVRDGGLRGVVINVRRLNQVRCPVLEQPTDSDSVPPYDVIVEAGKRRAGKKGRKHGR